LKFLNKESTLIKLKYRIKCSFTSEHDPENNEGNLFPSSNDMYEVI